MLDILVSLSDDSHPLDDDPYLVDPQKEISSR